MRSEVLGEGFFEVEVEKCEPEHQLLIPEAGWPDLELRPRVHDLGHLAIVTPLAPEHIHDVQNLTWSLEQAWEYSHGPFSSYNHATILDVDKRGPGWGRNEGIRLNQDADWYLFLDADDIAKKYTFELMNTLNPADVVFGCTETWRGTKVTINPLSMLPFTWETMCSYGAGMMNVAMFTRGILQRKVRWFEEQVSEDFEMAITLMAHGKYQRLPQPLVTINSVSESTARKGKRREVALKNSMAIRSWWTVRGRRSLEPDVLRARNEAETFRDFYPMRP